MEAQGSYQFELLEGRQNEARFLAERANLRLEGFKELLIRHGIPRCGRALELGCGQGIRTRLMAESFPEVGVTGVDRSEELLSEARVEGTALTNLKFQKADLYELPFENESFDFVYSRLVFMHLNRPAQALGELARVLKPGGRVLIEDGDRDCMFFEPAPPTFREFWQRVQDGQRAQGGDPNVGRKLAPYLIEAGFRDVRVETQPIMGGGPEIDFLVRTLLPSLNTYLPQEEREEGLKAIADLAGLAQDPRASFYHFWFAVSAERNELTNSIHKTK